VVAERDALAAQIKADALTLNDRIQRATKQGELGCYLISVFYDDLICHQCQRCDVFYLYFFIYLVMFCFVLC